VQGSTSLANRLRSKICNGVMLEPVVADYATADVIKGDGVTTSLTLRAEFVANLSTKRLGFTGARCQLPNGQCRMFGGGIDADEAMKLKGDQASAVGFDHDA
jgi:hypothetical protein